MVWKNPQHQRSGSLADLASPSSTCGAMSLDDGAAPAATAAEFPAFEDGVRSDVDGEPAATGAAPLAGGETAGGAAEACEPPPGQQPGSSGHRPAAAAAAAAADAGVSLLDDIRALRLAQKKARDEKKRVSKDLRNAEKRRQRLKRRAKQLSDADLLAVMTLRSSEKALGGQDAAGGGAAPMEREESETGSVTSASTRCGTGSASSPAQAKRRSGSG